MNILRSYDSPNDKPVIEEKYKAVLEDTDPFEQKGNWEHHSREAKNLDLGSPQSPFHFALFF